MNKGIIKIVKRNEENEAGKAQISAKAAVTEKEIRVGIVGTVNNWINERRENKRMEKVFSDNKIANWNLWSGAA